MTFTQLQSEHAEAPALPFWVLFPIYFKYCHTSLSANGFVYKFHFPM